MNHRSREECRKQWPRVVISATARPPSETNHYRRKRESGTNQKSKLPWKVQREQPGMMRGFSQFNDSTSHEFNNNSLQKPFFVANGKHYI